MAAMAQELHCPSRPEVHPLEPSRPKLNSNKAPTMPKDRKTSRTDLSGFQLRPEEDAQAAPATDLPGETAVGEDLPHSYGQDTIFLIAQEPHWLFTYWDIDISKHPGGPTFLRCCTESGTVEQEIEVPFETRNWYIPVKQAGASYLVEIGYRRAELWNVIARSALVQTPPENLSADENFDFATIPLHLSFQRLADNIQSVMRSGENLMQAVSRMQRSGDYSGFGDQVPSLVTLRQREVLLSLLGADLVDQLAAGGLASSELHSRVQARLEELLSSASASETLATLESLTSASGVSSEGVLGGSSFDLSSWSPVQTASWAAGWITSWAKAAPSSWNATTSWDQAAGGGGSSETSSWAAGGQGTTSWSHGALASWLSAAGSSGGGLETSSGSLASLTSWLSAVQSSWAEAALASGPQAASSSWMTSLGSSGSSGWSGGGSEAASSFSLVPERKFFMHVNAEVIFYGGTDPKAKLTIDGNRVALAEDGTFRYHCVFPNGEYEIPIVAESPDGLETRSARLRFVRETGKVGIVTDTPQPPFDPPVGRVR
jgi:hypothetical protein